MKFIKTFASALSFSIISVATPAVAQQTVGQGNWDYRRAPVTYGQEDQHHGYDKCQILNDNRSGFGGATSINDGAGINDGTYMTAFNQKGLIVQCTNFLDQGVEKEVFFGGPQTKGFQDCQITNGHDNNVLSLGTKFSIGPVVITCNSYHNNVNEIQSPYNEDNCPESWHGTNPPDCMKDCNDNQEVEPCGNAEYCTY